MQGDPKVDRHWGKVQRWFIDTIESQWAIWARVQGGKGALRSATLVACCRRAEVLRCLWLLGGTQVWWHAAEVRRICTPERIPWRNGRSLKTGVDIVSENTQEQLNTQEFLVLSRSSGWAMYHMWISLSSGSRQREDPGLKTSAD